MDTLCSMTLEILNPVHVAVTVLSTNVEFKTFASKSLVTSMCLLWWILSFSSISYKVSFQVATVLVIQSLSHVWLCDPTDRSTPGFPVLCYLLEFAQTHVFWDGDAIQPSHPLSPPSPALSLSQHQSLFQWIGSLLQLAKVLEFQLQYHIWK